MNGILIDSSVLLDLFTDDPLWADWSQRQLEKAAGTHSLFINAVIYSEISLNFERIEQLDRILDDMNIRVLEISREALFLAARIFLRYRRQGGAKTNVLPDFFIGAQALTDDLLLLTRDSSRIKHYLPGLQIICPSSG